MTNLAIKIYDFFSIRKSLIYIILGVVTLICALGASHLQFGEDISDFLPTGNDYSKVSRFVSTASGNSRIMIFFHKEDFDTERIAQCMDKYVSNLRASDADSLFIRLASKYDDSQIEVLSEFVQKNIPLFLDSADYLHADSLLTAEHAENALETYRKLLQSPAPRFVKTTIKNDPLGLFIHKLSDLKNFRPAECYSLINGHIYEPEMNRGIVFMESPTGMSESNVNAKIISLLSQNIASVGSEFPDIDITLFGAPVIAVGNSRQIKFDTILTTVLSIVLILVILWFSIRNLRNMIFMTLTLMFGYLMVGAVAWLVLGRVSLIALGISAVFTGIAVNYPLHFITHLYHCTDIRQNIREIAHPLIIGNITTVLAFFSLMFAGSNALRDLGFIGGMLLTASILFTIVFLPQFVVRVGVSDGGRNSSVRFSFDFLHRKAVVIPVLILTPVLVYLGLRTEFDSDLHNINFMEPDVRAEASHTFGLLNSDTTVSVFVTAMGRDIDEALINYESAKCVVSGLKKQNLICKVSGIGDFLPSKSLQQSKIDLWNSYMNERRDSISVLVYSTKSNIGQNALMPFMNTLNKDFEVREYQEFDYLAKNLLGNYIHTDSLGVAIVSILKVRPDDSDRVVEAFSGLVNDVAVYDERIVAQSFANILNDNFNYVLFTAGLIVFVFLWISYGNIELSLISFVPLAVSWFWILGIMYLGGIRFNIVNIILATFIFGQGDDYAVFMTEGLMYEYSRGKKVLASFKNSVAVSSLIMFVGIGSLILAKHPAMHSLGVVVIIGMFSVVLSAFIFPPLLFRFLTKKGTENRAVPYSLRNILFSIYDYICFGIGCIIVCVRSLFVSDAMVSKRRFHRFAQICARIFFKVVPVRLRFHNDYGETFAKPSVIVANHSSFFDVLALLSYNPNLLFITNERQQRNPLYGKFLQKADNYAVSDGYDSLAVKLHSLVDSGFSIVIFPEGTRSADGRIHRFHQGAFQLAKNLGLDILPVVIHGAGHCYAKGEVILRHSKIDIFIEKRIASDSVLLSDTALETARNVRHYFLDLYEKRRQECVDFDYAKARVMERFMYKGADIIHTVSKGLDNNRQSIMNKPVAGAVVFDDKCYGADALLFSILHPEARVEVQGEDDDRLAVARECGV